MYYINFKLILIVSLIIIVGCGDNITQQIASDEVKYIDKFPKNIKLKPIKPLDLDLMGAVDFFVADTFLIFKRIDMDKFWSIYSINSLKHQTDLLWKGSGANEFIDLPSNEYSFTKDSNLYCNIFNSNTNQILQIDLTKSISNKKNFMTKKIDLKKAGVFIANCFQVNDSTYFICSSSDNKSFQRFLMINNKKQQLPQCDFLDNVKIKNDLNTLAAARIFNKSNSMVVEAMLRMDQINLYSIKNNKQLTICTNTKLCDVNQIDKTSKLLKKKYYGFVQMKDNYFAALYFNESLKNVLFDNIGSSYIQFFDWSGKALLQLELPYIINSFQIYNDKLYVFSRNGKGNGERLYCYSIGNYLPK